MKSFGYPKETRGTSPWKHKPMRIINGRVWWCEAPDFWWREDDGECRTDPSELSR
jgi:hypothetical protein